MELEIRGERLLLLPEKAVFWPAHSRLFLSDVHLGKTQHFRKNGLALSSGAEEQDLDALRQLIAKLNPEEIYVLGDLFHSDLNAEWALFSSFLEEYPTRRFFLVPGNHDVLSDAVYRSSRLTICQTKHPCGPFNLLHEAPDSLQKEAFYIYGHVHPGVLLKGKGRQALRLPAFYLSNHSLLLPAFGRLTGLHIPQVPKSVKAYAVGPDAVFEVPLLKRF